MRDGSRSRSVHENSLIVPLDATSNTPVPRTTRPVCRTTQRCGGYHSVITIVSVKPTRPRPVRAVTVAPTPCPPDTRVASIQSPCRGQSIASRHSASGSAGTSTREVISTSVIPNPP